MNLADIPVVILAGGRGARFDHESQVKPKPMIEVAGKPILEHIVDSFIAQGFREFIIPVGYLGEQVCSWAARGFLDQRYGGDIPVRIVDTGEDSHTGERLRRLQQIIGRRRFVLTYGDGLSDVDMAKVIERHEKTSTTVWWGEERPEEPTPALITVTSVRPAGRFGAIEFEKIDDWGVGAVRSFQEKPSAAWINGGFMVVEPGFIDHYIAGDGPAPPLESVAMSRCASEGYMRAYRHTGFWMCMDTRRDLEQIERAVADNGGKLPWMRGSSCS